MNDTAIWIIAISTLVTAIAFLVLVIFTISVVNVLRRTTIAARHLGEAIEKRVCPCPTCRCDAREELMERHSSERHTTDAKTQVIGDVLEWVVVGVSLWQKFKEKRKRK